MSFYGLFLSFFLGISIGSTLLSQPGNEYGSRIYFGHLYSVSSVETIVDSRFKLLAADFQDQIDYLKSTLVKESKTANKGVFESKYRHEIKKRQIKTSPSTQQKKFGNMNSSCTFFYPDYPDAGLEKSKNAPIEMLKAEEEVNKKQENVLFFIANKEVFQSQPRHEIKKRQTKSSLSTLQGKFENLNSSCTFYYPDNPDAGLEKSKNDTFEMLKAGKEVHKKQENSKSKSMKSVCEHSTPFCTFIHLDHHGVGRVNSTNSKTVTNNQKKQDPTGVKNTLTNGIDPLIRDIEELKIQNTDQSKRIYQLEQKLAMLQSTTQISSTLKTENKKDNSRNGTSNNSGQVSKTLLTPPSSCEDLAMIDHNLNGLYLVKNKQTKKIQIVFCNFSDQVSQNLIGYADIKKETIHFYVQKKESFGTTNAVMPFELSRLNEGNAFNLTSGIFTVPVPGIYHFDFSGIRSTSALIIHLQVNGYNIGLAHANHFTSGTHDSISLSASLRLAAGDKVNLFNEGGALYDDGRHYTHFTGWLVEEDMM